MIIEPCSTEKKTKWTMKKKRARVVVNLIYVNIRWFHKHSIYLCAFIILVKICKNPCHFIEYHRYFCACLSIYLYLSYSYIISNTTNTLLLLVSSNLISMFSSSYDFHVVAIEEQIQFKTRYCSIFFLLSSNDRWRGTRFIRRFFSIQSKLMSKNER